MGYARNVVAYPFYLLAIFFICRRLFTAIAQQIAGDESEPSRRQRSCFGRDRRGARAIAAMTAWVASDQLSTNWSRMVPQQPMDLRGAKAEFTPDQTVWVKAMIRLSACTFAGQAPSRTNVSWLCALWRRRADSDCPR
jgi:hypothetical protein